MMCALVAACAKNRTTSGDRPVIERSAAEVFAPGTGQSVESLDPLALAAADQLNFFDELESRELAAQDDVLHACLLVGAGVVPVGYEQRMDLARKLGWIDRGWVHDGREATTIADAGRVVLRMLGQRDAISDERVMLRLRSQRFIPEGLEAYQGLTGTQLITLVGKAHDALTPAAIVRAKRVLEGVETAQAVVPQAGEPEPRPAQKREPEPARAPAIVDLPPPPVVPDTPVPVVQPAAKARPSRFVPGTPLRKSPSALTDPTGGLPPESAGPK